MKQEDRLETINEWLDRNGIDRAYKKDMKKTFEREQQKKLEEMNKKLDKELPPPNGRIKNFTLRGKMSGEREMTEKLREKLMSMSVGVWINGKWLSGQLYNGSITEILQAIKDYRDEEGRQFILVDIDLLWKIKAILRGIQIKQKIDPSIPWETTLDRVLKDYSQIKELG